MVHGFDDGMDVTLAHAAFVGDIVAHGVALEEVAIVDEDGVGGFGADGVDEAGGFGEADLVAGAVAVIVVG